MKKSLFFMAAAMILAAYAPRANAQLFKFGVKAGLLINTESLSFRDNGNLFDENSTRPGFELGFQATVKIPALPIIIQPELLYSRTSSTYSTHDFGELKLRSNRFEVPVLLGFQPSKMFRIMLGPVFAFPMTDIVSMDNKNVKFAPRYKNFAMGYQAGVGVTLGRVTIDARYQGHFSSLTNDNINVTGIPNVEVKNSRFAFSVGYTIFKIL